MEQDLLAFPLGRQSGATEYQLMQLNEKSSHYGLVLSREAITELVTQRQDVLREAKRIEFGSGILPNLIETFLGSPYLEQASYTETLSWLQEEFYRLKEEASEQISDDDLLDAMREFFDTHAHGSQEYFEGITVDTLNALVSQASLSQDFQLSESDLYEALEEGDRHFDESKRGIERIYEPDELTRPDQVFADNFYNEYYDAYQKGLDFNSRIGGSLL